MNKINSKMITDYIAENQLTKKAFAEKSTISVKTLNSILGQKNVSLVAIFKVAKAMEKNMYELFSNPDNQ